MATKGIIPIAKRCRVGTPRILRGRCLVEGVSLGHTNLDKSLEVYF